jgi:hypothetical protein
MLGGNALVSGELAYGDNVGGMLPAHAFKNPTGLTDVRPSADQLRLIIQQTREMVRYVDCARDAMLLVRRAKAIDRMVDEALKSCRLLEEQQFDLRQDATEAHLRTLRRAGQLLAEIPMHAGGRPSSSPPDTGERPPTLRELGISGHESHRWQRIARLPDDWFEAHIRDCREHRRELTTSSLLVLAKRFCEDIEDAEAGDARPSSPDALFREYEAVKGQISDVIWLDPVALARSMGPASRREELDRLRRWRTWLDEFEQALAIS